LFSFYLRVDCTIPVIFCILYIIHLVLLSVK